MAKMTVKSEREKGEKGISMEFSTCLKPKSMVRACADFVYCWAYCLSILQDIAGYAKTTRRANERWIGNDGNHLKHLISALLNRFGLNVC